MKLFPKQFLGLDSTFTEYERSAVAALPIPYEGGCSYGKGAAKGPDAVLEASCHLELYDELLQTEPYRMGIATVMPPKIYSDPESMQNAIYQSLVPLIQNGKFVVVMGGDHSVSIGYAKALHEKYSRLSVIQLDAHADLRDVYDGSPFSHACVMSRIREFTCDTLQIGIRSMSIEEARRVERENMAVCTMSEYRSGKFDVNTAMDHLPDPVFLTLDVDVFDWSVVRSTGTPEPGGFLWDEAMALLQKIFATKNIVGFDVVELSYDSHDPNSAFAVAKLIYKMLGFKLAAEVRKGSLKWPDAPCGNLF
ncbi:agmatinase [Thermodesulfobacteriota bacterium]